MANFSRQIQSNISEVSKSNISFSDLLRQSKRFIETAAKKYRGSRIDLEDLKQVGQIAAWMALRAYNPNVGVPLEHYVRRSIINAMVSELRMSASANEFRFLDLVRYEAEEDDATQVDLMIMIEDSDPVIKHAIADEIFRIMSFGDIFLTKAESKVFHYIYSNDMTIQEVADQLGTSHQNISKLHQKAIDKCRRYLEPSLQ